MVKFHSVTATPIPLMRANIDTDTIIPAAWLRSVSVDLGKGLFAGWRYDEKGHERPDFVLNRPWFRDGGILMTGDNFGCGSSREQAVWALLAFGIRCVVAPSFGEIFYENCIRNGLLPLRLAEDIVVRLAAEAEGTEEPAPMTVDLAERTVRAPGGWFLAFEIAQDVRSMLLAGFDEITRTLEHEREIIAFQTNDRTVRPWIYEAAAPPASDTDK